MIDDDAVLEVLETALRERGEVRVPAVGLSMGAWFAACDGLVIARFRPGCLSLGRIAVFRCADRWVAHRILLRWRDRYVTKGDGVGRLDRPLPRQPAMIGEVVAVVRGGRRVDLNTASARAAGCMRALLGCSNVVLGSARRVLGMVSSVR